MKWPTAKLRQVAPPERSARDFAPDEVVWHLNLDQIESQTGRILEKKRAPASQGGVSTFAFDENHVLYSKLRPYLNKVVRPDEPGIATSELVPLRPLPDVLNPDFLKFYLRSDRFVGFANQVVAGAKMPRMIMDKFWLHEIPLPAPREQGRLVELLEQADELRRKRAKADQLADRILPALFHMMFGDPVTNPKGWLPADGSKIFSEIRYGVGTPPPFAPSGIPFLRAGNIDHGTFIPKDLVFFSPEFEASIGRSHVSAGDIVVVRRGAYTGDCAVVPPRFDGAYVGYDLICVPSKTTNPDWFCNAFLYPTVWQRVDNMRTRAAQQGLNKEQILSFSLPYPPKPLQDQFSGFAQKIRYQQQQGAKSKEHLENLFATMLHHAFTGELTAKWREAHLKELLVEMEHQAKLLRTAAETN
jgi:type I restriction enzyme S subunit